MKRIMMVILAVALIIPAGQAFAASTTKKVTVSYAPMHYLVDGIEYAAPADQVGFIYTDAQGGGHTYVPARFVASVLNKSVYWDAKINKVTISDPHVIDPIDSKINGWEAIRDYLDTQKVEKSVIEPLDASKVKRVSINANQADIIYEFDGVDVKPNANTPGFLYEGRLYVPLRFMYESLGFNPVWDAKTYTISTETKPEQLEYQNAVKAVDELIMNKINKLSDEFVGLLFSLNSMSDEEVAAAKENVDQTLKDARVEVEAWLAELTQTLTEANHPTNIVEEYNVKINSLEKQVRDFILQQS